MAKKAAKKRVTKTKLSAVGTKARRRRNNPGVVEDIPTIGLSQLRSSIHPAAEAPKANERTITVAAGTTLIIKII